MSLIPAKLYYGEDVSVCLHPFTSNRVSAEPIVQDQWQRKKQTPEQKKAAKLAKLDPDNWKSAKDVMDERAAAARKRKRDEEGDEHLSDNTQQSDVELPKAIQDAQTQRSKKRKVDETESSTQITPQIAKETEEERIQRKKAQHAAKKERKQQQRAKALAKLERQQEKKKAQSQPQPLDDSKQKTKQDEIALTTPIILESIPPAEDTRIKDNDSVTSISENELPTVFSPPQESGTSSTSSILPTVAEDSGLSKPTVSSANSEGQTPRERLQAAISQLRADRKADGASSKGPKSRQELLEQRRRKEEERKAAKKEQKRREKEEEARQQDEEIARRFSPGGSGSLLASPRSPVVDHVAGTTDNNFSFGRVAFDDGTQLDPTISGILPEHRKKGATDTAAALKVAQTKKAKLAGLDEAKRKEIEEKDMWLNAKRKAHGEHVRDDTSLLKKALKRQQGQKKKSEKEWTERTEGVQKSQFAKQKKRTENLAKRKDDKQGGKGKKIKRPGFEGSFKGRTGGKRKA